MLCSIYILSIKKLNNMILPPKELQNILEKINKNCILLTNRDNLDIKFTKLDFLYDLKMLL